MELRTSTLEQPPPPRQKPAFAQFLWDRRVSYREASKALKRSHEYVRRICLPFGDPNRRVPDDEVLARIATYTGGSISKLDFEDTAEAGASAALDASL